MAISDYWEPHRVWARTFLATHGHLPTVDSGQLNLDDLVFDALGFWTEASEIDSLLPEEPRIEPTSRYLALSALWQVAKSVEDDSPDLGVDRNEDRRMAAQRLAHAELKYLPVDVVTDLSGVQWEITAAIA